MIGVLTLAWTSLGIYFCAGLAVMVAFLVMSTHEDVPIWERIGVSAALLFLWPLVLLAL